MSGWLDGFMTLPPYGIAALLILLLYVLQSEIRFGARARSHSASEFDRGSTLAIKVAAAVPVAGFVLAMKATAYSWIPGWFRDASLPGMPAIAWAGAAVGMIGILVRIWAVFTLRERYTRTLLVHEGHAVERRGPYRWVRHPGYLGSLLCLNGIAMASGNLAACAASVIATAAAYAYRIRVEDEMLVQTLGATYAAYRRDVAALIPFTR